MAMCAFASQFNARTSVARNESRFRLGTAEACAPLSQLERKIGQLRAMSGIFAEHKRLRDSLTSVFRRFHCPVFVRIYLLLLEKFFVAQDERAIEASIRNVSRPSADTVRRAIARLFSLARGSGILRATSETSARSQYAEPNTISIGR
jgi:hypothetical protein